MKNTNQFEIISEEMMRYFDLHLEPEILALVNKSIEDNYSKNKYPNKSKFGKYIDVRKSIDIISGVFSLNYDITLEQLVYELNKGKKYYRLTLKSEEFLKNTVIDFCFYSHGGMDRQSVIVNGEYIELLKKL